ncbi:MAG: GDP-mannose 4,6-dehydratase [Candidatus Subteraquimicrobiales bacterium]|nr:GDP-mannose 4,6-dehydratase [Candidatus Subteraquimicrobiales bacterium]
MFHLAAESPVASSWRSPVNIMNNNMLSQINIFEAVRELELSTRIIVACSSEEYGLINESALPVNENCCLNPLSTYAVSKVSQDMLAYQYFKSYDMDIVRVRSFNLTGELYLKIIFGITGLMDRLNLMIPIARFLDLFKKGESYVVTFRRL